jgi:hypothetical protein
VDQESGLSPCAETLCGLHNSGIDKPMGETYEGNE